MHRGYSVRQSNAGRTLSRCGQLAVLASVLLLLSRALLSLPPLRLFHNAACAGKPFVPLGDCQLGARASSLQNNSLFSSCRPGLHGSNVQSACQAEVESSKWLSPHGWQLMFPVVVVFLTIFWVKPSLFRPSSVLEPIWFSLQTHS